ncbi:YhdP family protein [Inhella gelatinilytica]|uniref:TIGR02099 family protein n=1 Tax=Inhella gelatinilytica TaxID=2795030 RepID=A0A931ITK5_9BURK|nr:YhdP family protein [Inhella gelatinilytica]MBH9551712.1 TIGR02099 family protein [Inhella gelatinilytica]
MSSLVSKIVAASHRPARWLRRGLRALLWMVLGLWFVVLGLWLLLHWWILPNLDRWRPQIEAQGTQWLGAPLKLGAIEVRTGGWIPVVEVRDVQLLDPQGRPALQLPRVTAALSARSLLTLTPRLEQLFLHEPQLALRRDAQGRLWVAGQLMRNGGSENNALLDWLMRQHELALRGGQVHWIDEMRGAEPLSLTGVDLVWRNGLRRHELRLDATPPAGWGQRLSLRARISQPLLARPSDWRRWSGLFYADLPHASAAELRRHIDLPFDLREGEGAFRAWAEMRQGHWVGVDLDVALRAAHLRLSPKVDPLHLRDLQTRLSWQQVAQGTRWMARGLQFALQDEGKPPRNWASKQLTLSLDHAEVPLPWLRAPASAPGAVALKGGQLQADHLDLGLLADLAGRLPVGEALQHALQARQPQGHVQQIVAQWKGSLDAPQQWRVDATAEGLAWAGLQPAAEHQLGQPGLRGAALTVNASEQGGQAQISVHEGQLDWPGLLPQDQTPISQAQVQIQWTQDPLKGWAVHLKQARVTTPDGQLSLDGEWRRGTESAARHGHLTLHAELPRLAVQALPRYLPLALHGGVRRYLAESLQSGQVRDVELKLKGPLDQFPFEAGGGQFRVRARAEDLRYAFVPSHEADERGPTYTSPWPALEDLQGELLFEGPGMFIRKARTRVGALEATAVQASVAHLAKDPLMKIEGQWKGPAQDALQFMRATPIGGWTGHALDLAQASGGVTGKLALQIPLMHPEKTTVQGSVQMAGNELRLRPDLPPFAQVKGRAEYTEHSLRIPAATARWLGGDLKLEGGSQPDQSLVLSAQGQATAEGLRQAKEWGDLVTGLSAKLNGQTPFQFRGVWKAQGSELSLQSPLTGLGSELPEPFVKSADAAWPLKLQWLTDAQRLDTVRIELGPQAQGLLQRAPGQALRGVLRVGPGGPLAVPEQGIAVVLNVPSLDLDAWGQQLRALRSAESGGTPSPSQIVLQTPQLKIGGRTLRDLVAGAQRDMSAGGRGIWRVSLQSQHLSGSAEWQEGRGKIPGQLTARLARVSLPKSEVEQVEQALDEASRGLPGLDIRVEDFELRGMKLGRLELRSEGTTESQPWALSHLALVHPAAHVQARGAWSPSTRRTELNWTLKLENSGDWLAALGLPNTVRGGKGELAGKLGWRGSPLSMEARGLDGQFTVQLGSGQFLKADPGAARLLGVLSLQSLPRRLLFDWRDVFSDGFVFDDFAGEVQIERGVARSSNLRMKGPQASVLMDGSADLGAETADLKVLVLPDVNAGGASLAYATINPAVGLATFLAQLILRKPLAAAAAQQFHVHGPWADPKVDKIEKPEIPDANAPKAAASTPSNAPSSPASAP